MMMAGCRCNTEADSRASDRSEIPSSAAAPRQKVSVPNATTVAICLVGSPRTEYARNRIAPPLSVFRPTLWPIA